MNKHTIIASVAIIVIIMPFAYSVLNIHVAENIQYKWENEEKFVSDHVTPDFQYG